ncbi:MAG: hypothetical protein ACSLFQ_04705 [Thermoanaerobaculia bacterium]
MMSAENEAQPPEEPKPKPPGPRKHFSHALERFVTNVDSLATTLPLAMSAIQAAQKASGETLKQFIDQYATTEERGRELLVKVAPDHWLRFNKLSGRRRKFAMASRTVPSSYLVSLVSQFDAFIGDLIRALFAAKPDTLNVSEKALTFSQLAEFKTIDEARDFILEKEIEGVLRKSHQEQFEWLEGRFGLPLRKGLDSWPRFIELTERRNLLVHTGGVVSSQYLQVCKAAGVALEKDAAVGKTLKVSRGYFDAAYEITFEIAVKLAHVLWRKVLPEERRDADENLSRICYELLEDARYKLARELLDFATCVLKQHSTDEVRRRLVVNHAQAYKWLGNLEKALEIMSGEDWTATSDMFKLADAVIRDDFELAAKFMERIGKSTERTEYRDWPLFMEFRKTDVFLRTYEQVFGEAFTVFPADDQRISASPGQGGDEGSG